MSHTQQASHARHWKPRHPAACRAEIERAARALSESEHGPTGEEALAQLEQRRRDDEAAQRAQGCLPLRGDQ